jgi:hypothetical protein
MAPGQMPTAASESRNRTQCIQRRPVDRAVLCGSKDCLTAASNCPDQASLLAVAASSVLEREISSPSLGIQAPSTPGVRSVGVYWPLSAMGTSNLLHSMLRKIQEYSSATAPLTSVFNRRGDSLLPAIDEIPIVDLRDPLSFDLLEAGGSGRKIGCRGEPALACGAHHDAGR